MFVSVLRCSWFLFLKKREFCNFNNNKCLLPERYFYAFSKLQLPVAVTVVAIKQTHTNRHGRVWLIHAFLWLKPRNNTNVAIGNTITSKITSWLYVYEHFENRGTIYSYSEIVLKPAVVSCLTNALAPPPTERAVQGLKRIGQTSSLHSKKFFSDGVADFCDVISEVVLRSFWLMLPGLGPNR